MQVEEPGLKLSITKSQFKNFLRIGEIIEAKVVSKKSAFKYILNIKGNRFEAVSTTPLKHSKILLKVKSLSPKIILQIQQEQSQETKNITLKQSDLFELLQNTNTEQEIIADVIEEKKGLLKLNINGKIVNIKLEEPVNADKIKLILDQENKEVIISRQSTQTISFKKEASAIIINDQPKLIEEIISKIEDALKKNDRIKLAKNIIKFRDITKQPQLKGQLEKIEQRLLKEKIIDKQTINKLIEKLKSDNETGQLKKLSNLIKETLKEFGSINSHQEQNIFSFLPFIINNKEKQVYLKKEKLPSFDSKKNFKITVALNSSNFGVIIINGFFIGDTTSVSLFLTNKRAFDSFKTRESELKKLLGNINLYIGLSKEKPIIIQQHLNIKI